MVKPANAACSRCVRQDKPCCWTSLLLGAKLAPKLPQHLDHLAESYSERCQFVLICVDGSVDEAVSFAEEHGITRCIVASVVDENAPASYHVSGLPHHTLIAPDGTIARNYEVNLPGDLDEALAKEISSDSLVPVPKEEPHFRQIQGFGEARPFVEGESSSLGDVSTSVS